MTNEFEKFSFEQEYLGYTFWFTENRIPFLNDKVLFICSKCNKKEIRPFKKFLDTCLKHDKVLCKKCCLSIFKEWSLYKGNPMQLKETATILGPLFMDKIIIRQTKIKDICEDCGKEIIMDASSYFYNIRMHDGKFLCRNCGVKHTCEKTLGVKNPLASKEIREKSKKVIREKYGVDNVSQSEEIKNKKKETTFIHFGVEWPTQSEEVINLRHQNNIKKYGVVEPSQTKEIKEKTARSNLEKYGYEWTTQVPEFIKKKEQTFLKNYGVPHYFQSEAFQRVSSNKYKYKELNFDSSWELAYFIYNEDHNIPIIRLPQRIEYFLEEESHHYYPDFLVEGQLIEIKSSATLNNDLSLKPHFKQLNRCKTEEEKQYLYDLCAVKTQCMRENNVQIISNKEIKPYLKYIKNTYGKDYLKQFKKEKD